MPRKRPNYSPEDMKRWEEDHPDRVRDELWREKILSSEVGVRCRDTGALLYEMDLPRKLARFQPLELDGQWSAGRSREAIADGNKKRDAIWQAEISRVAAHLADLPMFKTTPGGQKVGAIIFAQLKELSRWRPRVS